MHKNTESTLTPLLCANNVALKDDTERNILKIKWTLKKKNLHDSDVYNQKVRYKEFWWSKVILLHKILIINTKNYSLYDQKLNIFYYVTDFVIKKMLPKIFSIFCNKACYK